MEKKSESESMSEAERQSKDAGYTALNVAAASALVGGVAGAVLHDPMEQKAAAAILRIYYNANYKHPGKRIMFVTDDATKGAINAYLKKEASDVRIFFDSLPRWQKGVLVASAAAALVGAGVLIYRFFRPNTPVKDPKDQIMALASNNDKHETDLSEPSAGRQKQKSFVAGLAKEDEGKIANLMMPTR